MGLKRIFGICETGVPNDGSCWSVQDGVVEVQLDKAPELTKQGAAMRHEGQGLEPRLLLLNGIDGKYHAYENACACSGWRLDPVEGEEKVQCCTLMASTYDYDGKKLSGPAEKDVVTHPVEEEDGKLTIRLSR